ncbi:hypothetical protein BKP37_15730 [Anaerobacillus alkalilacustris]|uniref:Uncharacterized protein n=1 Tax=Anaerobacillus alkalilacustris TaxID=393763 RepID=A0A1S2LFV2_9BACI|nr:hypothetical protein [Anaerobacillus alkalilacustris]OIJ11402.1 hypothetical protein BKP37_15730 [Anaerobacillus alkalilacustris]
MELINEGFQVVIEVRCLTEVTELVGLELDRFLPSEFYIFFPWWYALKVTVRMLLLNKRLNLFIMQ